MKKMTKKLFSLLLALSLVLGMFPSSSLAAPLADEKKSEAKAETTDEKVSVPSTEAKDALSKEIKLDGFNTTIKLDTSLEADADVVVDEKDPAIKVVKAELKDMKVLNEDGESVPLTEEQINNILALYQQYLDNWAANANVLGVQTPFFLQYNDEEDSLGVLGEMLAMSNIPVAAVRAGRVSYDDLTGMIMNFYYGDALGVQYYGKAIAAARDEAIATIEASGAQTEAQKLLVLNDWLAHVNTFDMPYIMNTDKEEDEKPMVAEEPVKQEHYEDVYAVIYDVYEEQIHDQFYNQIYAGIVASIRMDVYKAAIKQVVYDAAYDQAYDAYIAENSPEGGETETPDGGETTVPEGGETTVPEGGETETPEGDDAATVADEDAGTTEGDDAATEEPTLEEAADAYATEVATQAAEGFMTENAEAIEADPHQFVLDNFGEEAAAQISAQADAVVADAEKNGMVVDEKGTKMTVAQLTEAQMDVPLDDLNGMTPKQAVPVYADQAAQGLTNGVLNYWEGSHIGALACGTSVCLGYAKAYAYILQYMNPEVYGVNGAETDMSVSENWKAAKDIYYTDGALDITKDYAVDLVRITFDASVTMYGETQDNFNSDHFWNAVQIDGEWFYVDLCYTDVFTEVMSRDRVETDGSMNHLYFLFSHTSAVQLYDGNYSEIKTLYESAATHKNYEDAWMSRAASNVYSDGSYFYYVYDSTDLITMMEEYNDDSTNTDTEELQEDPELKLVRHDKTLKDKTSDGDTQYDALIEFNYKEDEDSDTSVARVYNPETDAMEENELLTKLYAQFDAESDVYPSLAITTALYEGKLYFNLSNCILSYDLTDGSVVVVKEYNTVSAKRDKTNPFGGMAFDIVANADEADFTVENHPIAGMTIKSDGKMYVAIATNFAFISGKDPRNSSDQSSYGYEFEESNYNPDYNSYSDDSEYDEDMLESMGYEKEINDNDEFMWSANFVETLDMGHLVGTSHEYAEVEVDAFCGRNGYTENRCTTCGAIEAETRVEDEDSAHAHHYVLFKEEYYTNDDNGNPNKGECYVCTECGFSIEEPTEPKENSNYGDYGTSYEEQMEKYEKEKAIYDEAVATAGHTYTATDPTWSNGSTVVTFEAIECSAACADRHDTLDCLLEDETIFITLSEAASLEAEVSEYEGVCTEGVVATYTATGEVEGYTVTASTEVEMEAGKHTYEGVFTWEDAVDEDGNKTGEYAVTADVTCTICGDAHEDLTATVAYDEENSTEPTCTEKGKDVYVATVVVTNDDGEELGTATGTKEVAIKENGHTVTEATDNGDGSTHHGTCTVCGEEADVIHSFEDGLCTICGAAEPATIEAPVIVSVYSTVQDSAKVTWTEVAGAEGYELWRATSTGEDAEWSRVKTIKDGSTVEYRNQQLTIGQTYYYKVRAYKTNAAEEKVYSEFSDVNYMPAAVVITNVYSNATFRLRLLWQEVSGAHGYQIWRKADDGSWKIIKTLGDKGNELTDNQGATTAYSNTGLEAGQTYTYKMRAFMITEDGKKVFGAYSDEFSRAVKPETPAVTGTSSKAGRAVLEWDEISGAAGYQVWMATSADGEYSITKSITDGETTAYTKYELESGKTYYFKVRAYSEADGRKSFSDYSEVVSVKVK